MPATSLDTALSLAARGLPCLPLKPGAKAPACPHGVKDATTDPDALRALFRRAPWADAEKGVGLACGGVVALDLDLDPAKGLDGAAALERSPLAGHLPATLSQRTPRGGRHLIYRWPEGTVQPRNGVGVLPGVDIRSAGGYVKVYALDDAPIAEAPLELVSFLLAPRGSPDGQAALGLPPKSPRPWDPHASPPAEAVVVDRARCYLSCCAPAIQGQHGHSSLLWAAHALVVGFDLPDGDALRLLWEEYNPRCVPPWDPLNPADRKDFERKVSEARRNPGAHRFGYLRDEPRSGGSGVPPDRLVAEGAAIARPLLAAPAPEPTAAPVGGSEAEPPSPDGQSAIGLPPSPAPAPWPADLLDPPGLVGEIARYILSNCLIRQPVFALGAALATCSVLMGRKIRCGRSRTNLYVLLLGSTSCGKEAPQQLARAIIDQAGASDLIEGKPSSDTAVVAKLVESPAYCIVQDEIGHMFAEIHNASKSGASVGGVAGIVLALFSKASGIFDGNSYANRKDRPSVKLREPSLSLLGATTPEKLYGLGGMTRAEIEDGFYPRFLTFREVEDATEDGPDDIAPIPDSIVSRCAEWRRYDPPQDAASGDIASALGAHPLALRATPEASAVFRAFKAECKARRKDREDKGDPAWPMWGKANELATRLALIIAAGRYPPGDPAAVEEESDATWAVAVVRRLVSEWAAEVCENVSDNPVEAAKNRIVAIVRKKGPKGMYKSEITRRTQFLKGKERDEYLDELVKSRRLECPDAEPAASTGGRKPALYRIPPSQP